MSRGVASSCKSPQWWPFLPTITNRRRGGGSARHVGTRARSHRGAASLQNGVIADYVVTEAMLRYFVERIVGRFRLFRPLVMVSVPVG